MQIEGVRFDERLAVRFRARAEGTPATTEGRAVDHIALRRRRHRRRRRRAGRAAGVEFQEEPVGARERAAPQVQRRALHRTRPTTSGWRWSRPDSWAWTLSSMDGPVVRRHRRPRALRRRPARRGASPTLQGVWTGNASHGIPLERPEDLADIENADAGAGRGAPRARHPRQHLGLRTGMARHDPRATTGTRRPRQVAMIVDPPDGRIPAADRRRVSAAPRQLAADTSGRWARTATSPVRKTSTPVRPLHHARAARPDDAVPGSTTTACRSYQGPGFVAIQKEMIHETRVVPTNARAPPPDGPAAHLVARQRAGPLGGRYARGRDDQLQRPGFVPRIEPRT